jgi:hypothetical protein
MEPNNAERRAGTSGSAAVYSTPDSPPATERWQPVEHIHLPSPTYWPAVLALGITFLAWGIVTSFLIAGVGLLLFVVALGGWIGDLLHEN